MPSFALLAARRFSRAFDPRVSASLFRSNIKSGLCSGNAINLLPSKNISGKSVQSFPSTVTRRFFASRPQAQNPVNNEVADNTPFKIESTVSKTEEVDNELIVEITLSNFNEVLSTTKVPLIICCYAS
jgi:hypothetical protein